MNLIFGSWLGGAIYLFFGVSIFDWKWWIFVIPTMILSELTKS